MMQHRINWKKVIVIALIALTIIQLFFYTIIFLIQQTNHEIQLSSSKIPYIIKYPNSSFDGQEPEAILGRVDYLLNQLPGFTDFNCSGVLAGDKNAIEKAINWKIPDFELVWKQIDESVDQ